MPNNILLITSLLTLLATHANTQSAFTNGSKRGIAYLGTPHPTDYNIFLSPSSPLTWYYNWSPNAIRYPRGFTDIEFVPLIHNLGSLENDIATVQSLGRVKGQPRHLLSFNEPDIGPDGGGSDISPSDAAGAYIRSINPLSVVNGGDFYISWPSTTGTLSGLNWLQRFNESCWTIDEEKGCHMDFVATHFYGDFPALASWLGTLNEWYVMGMGRSYGMWITEVALPQADAEGTERMMNTTLPYLDGLEYVERYSWFGMNRVTNANGWTGPGVCLLDANGDLTGLGARYLNGDNGTGDFKEGMSASEGGAERTSGGLLGVMIAMIVCLAWTI